MLSQKILLEADFLGSKPFWWLSKELKTNEVLSFIRSGFGPMNAFFRGHTQLWLTVSLAPFFLANFIQKVAL
jgi:hypothetical protein